MKPYVLRGHSRPITQVLYNLDGDLIFTTSKDGIACVWYSDNGERLGTLGNVKGQDFNRIPDQHRAAIWGIDVSRDSSLAITAAGDMTVKLWDVSNGQVKQTFEYDSTVRCQHFSMDANTFVCTQDKQSTAFAKLWVNDIRVQGGKVMDWKLSTEMLMGTRCLYGFMDETVLTADDKGVMKKFDLRTVEKDEDEVGIPCAYKEGHKKQIQNMRLNADRTMLLTSSKDKMVRLWDCMDEEFTLLKEIKHTTMANACAFHPTKAHIAVAGGQEAMNVTTTGAGQGNFETHIYNIISQEEICNFKGHFGPVNSLDIHPNGTQITTGGEEGYIRLNHLESSYINYRDHDMEMINNQMAIAV